MIRDAYEALKAGDDNAFDVSCELLAIIMRSAGNPLSPGRKTDELFPYFSDRGKKTVVSCDHLRGDNNHSMQETKQQATGALL